MKLGMCLLVWLAGFWFIGEADAQWYPYAVRPVRSLDRWLGVGYSGGYHTNNPGPDSDYYQPYSDLHTGLRSWQPLDSHVPQLPEEAPEEWRAPEEFPRGDQAGSNRGSLARPQLGNQRPSHVKAGPFGWDPSPRTAKEARSGRARSGDQLR